MKKKIFYILLFCLFSSCRKNSSEIDQKRIYQEYSVVYNNQTGNTEVSASFREDNASGKKLILTGGAKVYFNEQQISGKGNFSKTYSGFISPIKIDFVDSEGKMYTNYSFGIDYIDVNPLENFISGTNNYFSWGGNAISQNESVIFYARNSGSTKELGTFSTKCISAFSKSGSFGSLNFRLNHRRARFSGLFRVLCRHSAIRDVTTVTLYQSTSLCREENQLNGAPPRNGDGPRGQDVW
jgi:hypothetical protein